MLRGTQDGPETIQILTTSSRNIRRLPEKTPSNIVVDGEPSVHELIPNIRVNFPVTGVDKKQTIDDLAKVGNMNLGLR